MTLKIRTVYFKSKDITKLKTLYSELFNISPKPEKDTKEWVEFDFGNINLSFISLEYEKWIGSNCVPVFEFNSTELVILKGKVINLGGKILDVDYDEYNSVSCVDIEGNEFEITSFHD